MSLNQLYQQSLLAHNRAPRHRHPLDGATHRAHGLDALCGDDLWVWLKIRDGRCIEASWSGEACVVTTAAASMLTDWLPGRSRTELEQAWQAFQQLLDAPDSPVTVDLGELAQLAPVGGFPARRRNALLPWRTAIDAWDHGKVG